MRTIWSMLALVVTAGLVAMLWPDSERLERTDPVAPPPEAVPAMGPASSPAEPPTATASVRLERAPDGSMRLDGRFTVTGSGSEQDPLVVSWPLLASAAETVDADAGRLEPQPHINFLNGQWVQISGFLAPPLWGEQTTELLVMKNRWDGCCIGLPPTPFDCIEATLAEPIRLGAKHSISFGTVRGRLVVEPFRAGAFLIGLYRLESAASVVGH